LSDDPRHEFPWSYHAEGEEHGASPYTGATISTAAHHVSALSPSAGLAGRRSSFDESNITSAEYDPDRPVHVIIAGFGQDSARVKPYSDVHSHLGSSLRVVLPDVTGLTSAVESPAKGKVRKFEYPQDELGLGEGISFSVPSYLC
jgi:hypothetical protein